MSAPASLVWDEKKIVMEDPRPYSKELAGEYLPGVAGIAVVPQGLGGGRKQSSKAFISVKKSQGTGGISASTSTKWDRFALNIQSGPMGERFGTDCR